MRLQEKVKKWVKSLITIDEKKVALILSTVFFMSLIPLLYLSGYVHATGDDYGYGYRTHEAWLATHSIFEVLKAAGQTVVHYWHGWQGTWFTIFLMSLQPEVFLKNGYWIVPWLMLGISIASTSLVTHYFLVKKLKISRASWSCVNTLLLISMLQYFPSTKSGIFWWNGTVHYIVPYGLAMVAIYSMFCYRDERKKRFLTICSICMFFLGGSSYLAPLLVLIVLFYLLLFEGIKKRYLFWLLIPASIECGGLLVSFLSPGNTYRGGEDFGFHWTLIFDTVLNCFKEGILGIGRYMGEYPAIFFAFVLIAVFLVEALVKAKENFLFPMPIFFCIMMFCLYCAMYAPEIYAGVEVSGGVPNTIFQVFLLTVLADMVYVLGWICVRWRNKNISRLKSRLFSIPFLCIALCIVLAKKGTLKETSCYEAYEFIVSGEADDYREQMNERLSLLYNPDLKEVELPAMNSEQGPLMHMEVMEDPDEWTNMVVRQFFQKERVVRVPRK